MIHVDSVQNFCFNKDVFVGFDIFEVAHPFSQVISKHLHNIHKHINAHVDNLLLSDQY